jgi:hypothetical protein
MGSKFLLNSGESEWDGSVSELTVKNLIPGFPIKTDSNKKLISTKLEISDINGLGVLNIEIKETDEIIEIPTSTPYNTIQYKKSIQTPRNIIILFKGLQLAKLYFNRKQTVIFNKFNDTWIC